MTNDPSIRKELSPSTVRGHILFFFFVILTLAVAWRVREVLELIYVSALFAVILTPAVTRITQLRLPGGHRISRLSAILLLITLVFLGLFLFFFFALPPVIRDIHEFAVDLPARVPGILAHLHQLPMADKLGIDSFAQRAEDAATATAGYLVSSFPRWASGIFDLITAFVLCVYFMLEGNHAYRWLLSLFAPAGRGRLQSTFAAAQARMGQWLLGQGTLMLILGVTSTIVFGLLHVRYFILLGALMGLFNIVPIAGGIFTICLAAFVAALDSWAKMAGVLVFYAIYLNIENAILIPRIMRNRVDLMGLTIIVALLLGTALAGIVGALVAIPSAVLVTCFLNEYFVEAK